MVEKAPEGKEVGSSLSSPKLALSGFVGRLRAGLSATGSLQAHGTGVELCSLICSVRMVGIRVHVAAVAAAVAVGGRCDVRRRSPADTAHVWAARSAAWSLAAFNAGLEGRWGCRGIGRGMRGRADGVGVAGCSGDHRGRCVQIVAHMSRQRAVTVVLVLHGIGAREISTGRHGHGPLAGRGGRHGRAVVRDLIAIGAGRAC